jgi:hypothetical protein
MVNVSEAVIKIIRVNKRNRLIRLNQNGNEDRIAGFAVQLRDQIHPLVDSSHLS